MQRRFNKAKWWGLTLTLGLLLVSFVVLSRQGSGTGDRAPQSAKAEEGAINKALLAEQLGPAIRKNEFPSEVELAVDGSKKKVDVSYSLDDAIRQELEEYVVRRRRELGD